MVERFPNSDRQHLPVQVYSFDPNGSPGAFRPFIENGSICVRKFLKIEAAQAAISAAMGRVILSVSADAEDQERIMSLAKAITRINASQHVYVSLIVLFNNMPSLRTLDELEMLGVRAFLRNDADAISVHLRLLLWRFQKRPSSSVPCFYIHYPDTDTLEVFLLGPRQRTQLLYGEKLGTLFEMLALGQRWITTLQIANELEIGRSSSKEYLHRLRREYESKRLVAGVDVPAAQVFCSALHNGVWMHCLKAQILVLD